MPLISRFVARGRRLRLQRVLLGLVIGSIVGIGLRAGLFACAVLLLAVFAGIISPVMTLLPWADPVYTRAALYSLADIHLGGVAVAGPVGDALHTLFPSVVVSPARAQWLIVRVVLEPGSSVLGRLTAAGVTHAEVFAVALLLLRKGVQCRSAMLVSMSHPSPRETWFVWGTNCYQDYLGTLVDTWPDQGTGLALWVSEFAPGGVAMPDRPEQFQRMWNYVRRHPEWVLGGVVYAWTRNGPEEIDRNLGLTDDGTPADGRSLDAISGFFRTDVP